jgi:sulfite reductase (NADPH) hemoprotein beta-component
LCASGGVLVDFLPAGELLALAEAIVRAYHQLGDYEHRKRNRLKYLIRSLGFEGWKAAVERELDGVRAEGGVALPFEPESPPVEAPPERPHDERPRALLEPGELERRGWQATNVLSQRQEGWSVVNVRLPLGDATSAQLRALAALARAHGDGSLRTTQDQNLVLRWVRDDALPELYRGLAAAGLARGGAATAADVTSCPGAWSCRVAVTHSRGLAALVSEHLERVPELVADAGDLRLKVSGCPNGCGQHHVAGIGFQGSVRQVEGRAVPQYFVSVGGGLGAEGATFGRVVAKVPAWRVGGAVERLLRHAAAERRAGETTAAFLQRAELAPLRALLADLEAFDPAQASERDYDDPGQGEDVDGPR